MKKIIALSILIVAFLDLFSCTTFVLKDEHSLLFGRNLDWVSDNGLIVVNKRNILKKSIVFPPESSTIWTAKYGSITFNQFGKEFPFGGMNEKGLVIEIMLVAGQYPEFDDRTAVNELQWIQYQLDNAQSVEEVIKNDQLIRISKINQNLHFLVCDKEGNIAVIEFDSKGIKVYKDQSLPFPVLENDTYSTSLRKNKQQQSCRFNTAISMLDNYQHSSHENAVDYAFNILNKVALDGSWSIVYDIKNMEIHYKTASKQNIKKIKFNYFNLSCIAPALIYDLKRNQAGWVHENFIPFTDNFNQKQFNAAIKSNAIRLPQPILQQFYNYNATCNCKE
ncbi:MAG: linear amide C-N hydrolase [Flavobacteriales bacterium]|jgi:choloylglycine hydrolase|nr:linear amide C-N hydrolase [Flavobacteriales bacterium]